MKEHATAAELRSCIARWTPAMVVTALGLWLLWPIPIGHMPLSADHTVHLTRIWMYARELAAGHLHGWSPMWGFGTPVGELYPVLGDLLVIAVQPLSLGLAPWPVSYALGFTVVYLSQAWVVLRIGKQLELGPVVGLVAALLLLVDPGQYREGGWLYTVHWGVWPQALSTALGWLALGELARSVRGPQPHAMPRALGIAALALGGSILAHPMGLLLAVIGMPVMVLALGSSSSHRFRPALVGSLLALVLGSAVAAWWMVPMLDHRAWMANYGWLWRPLSWMVDQALHGHITQNMATPVGILIGLGLLTVMIWGNGAGRGFAGLALVLWFMASREFFWSFRLDRLGESFTHIQYQRFLIAAKPGLFLAAGHGVSLAGHGVRSAWRGAGWRRAVAGVSAMALVTMLGWTAVAQWRSATEHGVGRPQVERRPRSPEFATHYQRFLQWARQQWQQRDGFHRIAVRASRNTHWFMDAPVYTHTPMYKIGFTPGNNFVHKPERGSPTILDHVGARYLVDTRSGSSRDREVHFGPIRVRERNGRIPWKIAQIRGAGEVEVLEADQEHGDIRVRVRGAAPGSELVFNIAGYPRWHLHTQEMPVAWYETPVVGTGPPATPADRRAGKLSAGKAHGNDGTEPTLLATRAGDGVYHLQYRHWRLRDVGAVLVSLLGLAYALWLALRPGRVPIVPVQRALARVFRPSVVIALVLTAATVLGMRWLEGEPDAVRRSTGWVAREQVETMKRVTVGPIKADMLIRPAMIAKPRPGHPAIATFPEVRLGPALHGWVALGDDAAKMRPHGRHRMQIQVRTPGTSAWQTLHTAAIAHRPGTRELRIPTGDLAERSVDVRVVVEATGRPSPLGFELVLGAPS